MSRYPVITSGQRVTADLLSSMLPDIIVKPASEDRSSTTTFADDTDLTTTLSANAVYLVEFNVLYATTNVAGFRTAWTVPSGATGVRTSVSAGSAQTQANADNISGRWGVHNFTTATNHGDRNDSTNLLWLLERSVVTTTSSGTLALQWSQVTSSVNPTRVAIGSTLSVMRLS